MYPYHKEEICCRLQQPSLSKLSDMRRNLLDCYLNKGRKRSWHFLTNKIFHGCRLLFLDNLQKFLFSTVASWLFGVFSIACDQFRLQGPRNVWPGRDGQNKDIWSLVHEFMNEMSPLGTCLGNLPRLSLATSAVQHYNAQKSTSVRSPRSVDVAICSEIVTTQV